MADLEDAFHVMSGVEPNRRVQEGLATVGESSDTNPAKLMERATRPPPCRTGITVAIEARFERPSLFPFLLI